MSAGNRLRATCVALALGASVAGPGGAWADGPAQAARPLDAALRATQETGRPTVAVSPRLHAALVQLKSIRDVAASAQIVSLAGATATDGEVRVYRRGPNGPALVARLAEARDAYDALGWLRGKGLAAAGVSLAAQPATPKEDSEVERAGHWHDHAQPSAQGYPPVTAPPPTQQVTTVPVIQTPAPAYVQAPAPQPVVVQTAPTPVVLQQSPPTIYVAQPTTSANVQILAAPSAAPSVTMLQPVSAPQPTQLFLPQTSAPPQLTAGPQPTAQSVSAPPAMQTVAMPVVAAAPAPTQVAAAPALAAAPTEAIPPGLLGRMIGNFGEKLAKHKYPRMRGLTTTTTLAQPVATTAVPVQVQAVQQVAAPPQVSAPPPQVAQPPYPTPQGGHGLFKHFHH
jgi:hypothetical protein